MKLTLRATIEREIEVGEFYRDAAEDIILQNFVFGEDGLMADTAELLDGMTWEVTSREAVEK